MGPVILGYRAWHNDSGAILANLLEVPRDGWQRLIMGFQLLGTYALARVTLMLPAIALDIIFSKIHSRSHRQHSLLQVATDAPSNNTYTDRLERFPCQWKKHLVALPKANSNEVLRSKPQDIRQRKIKKYT